MNEGLKKSEGCTPAGKHLLCSELVWNSHQKKSCWLWRWCRTPVFLQRQLSRPSSSPPMHRHLLMCCRRILPTPLNLLVSYPLLTVSRHPCLVHLWCVFRPPSIIGFRCRHAVYETSRVSLCQALATGAAEPPPLHTPSPCPYRDGELTLASCYVWNKPFSSCCFTCKVCWRLEAAVSK